MLTHSKNEYHILGGHLEEGETIEECLKREILEEAGIEIEEKDRKPFYVIKYLCKDYPSKGDNSLFIANYFCIKADLEVNKEKIKLTESEKEKNLKVSYFDKNTIIDELKEVLDKTKNKNVVLDTIEVLEEWLKNN